MNNITYKINKLEILPSYNQFVNVVKTVHFSISISDQGYSTEIIDCINLSEPIPFQYISFDSLSQEIVEKWIKDRIDVQRIENVLKQKLESIKNPTVLANPPWNN